MKQHVQTMKKAFRLVQEVDKWYPWMLLAKNLFSALLPLYLSFGISFLVTELAGEKRISYLGAILVFLMVGAAFSKFARAVLEWNCSARYMKIQDAFTSKSSRKAMKMEFAATEDTEIQDLYAHAWRANLAAGTILEQLFSMIGFLIQIVGCIGVILGLEPLLLVVLLVFLVLFDWLEHQSSSLEGTYAKEVIPVLRAEEYTRQCMGDLSYAKDVRLYYPEAFFIKRLWGFQKERLAKERKKEWNCMRLQAVQATLGHLQTAALYVVLAYRFLQGKIPIGYVSLAVSSVTIFTKAVEGISSAWNQVLKNEVFLGYLERFWDLPEPKDGAKDKIEDLEELEFRHVWFRYPGAVEYALEDINVVLKKQEILTLVGENGSGKTTFVKLLLRLYHPTKGEIFVNGIPAGQYSDEAYQKLFAPVFQDYQLFAYSLRENLYFRQSGEEEKTKHLLEELRLWEKLCRLPKGLDQCIGKGYEADGIELSGGERQKLAIARAIGKNSPCVVLDEPTAALDPIAEVKLYQNIHQMAGEKTCVFITHRLAGIRFSQQILYFRSGKIAEQGSYEELMKEGKQFREFYELQAKLYEGCSVNG